MEALANTINRAFEALGSPIRATVEEGDLFVRDIIVTPSDQGELLVFEASNPSAPLQGFAAADVATVASVVTLHVVRRIIARAVED